MLQSAVKKTRVDDDKKAIKALEEYNLINQTKNPPVRKATKAIWILSSRHDPERNHMNCPVESVNFTPMPGQISSATMNPAQCDRDDDFERIKLALEIGQHVTALCASKPIQDLTIADYEAYAPIIIYNGWPKQNNSFRRVLAKGLETHQLINYPCSKFVIMHIPSKQIHTGTQFAALATARKTDSRVAFLNEDCEIVVVTSAYHDPRTRRLTTSEKHQYPFTEGTKISFHTTDRQFVRPCIERDLMGEFKRLVDYSSTGDIGSTPRHSDWYDLTSVWTPFRYVGKVEAAAPEVKDDLAFNKGTTYRSSASVLKDDCILKLTEQVKSLKV